MRQSHLTQERRARYIHPLGCSQHRTLVFRAGWEKAVLPSQGEKGETEAGESGCTGILRDANSGKQKCCLFNGECCRHPLESGDRLSLVQTGGLGFTVGVYPRETRNFHPPPFSSLSVEERMTSTGISLLKMPDCTSVGEMHEKTESKNLVWELPFVGA